MKAILERRSIRKYTNEPVSEEAVKGLLMAAMSAPSAGNEQPWEFIVVKDRELLKDISQVNPYAAMLAEAPLAIVVCGDLTKEKYKGFWVQDCSAATENILIAAQAKGLGTVWTAVYPDEDRVKGIRKIFGMPEHVVPMSAIAVGHPDETKTPVDRYDETRIHNNKW